MAAVGYARGKSGQFAEKLGFVCNDKFQDNGFVQGDVDLGKFREKIIEKRPIVAILPDYHVKESLELINDVIVPIWIYPLHKKEELQHFEGSDVWIGFPHRKDDKKLGRDYSLKWFLESVQQKKWWLGLWDDTKFDYLRHFDGFDTTMFFFLAMKQGSIWTGWGKRKKSRWKGGSKIIRESLENFKDYLEREGLIIEHPGEGIL